MVVCNLITELVYDEQDPLKVAFHDRAGCELVVVGVQCEVGPVVRIRTLIEEK